MVTIIPAAGKAKRFGYSQKTLLEINKKSLLSRLLTKTDGRKILIVNEQNKDLFRSYSSEIQIWSNGAQNFNSVRGCLYDIMDCLVELNVRDDICIICADLLFSFSLDSCIQKGTDQRRICIPIKKGTPDEMQMAGSVCVDSSGTVSDFAEHRVLDNSNFTQLGIYFIPKHLLYLIEECYHLDSPGYLIEYAFNLFPVCTDIVDGFWFHINTKEDYEKARDMVAYINI
jgi:NDP-sugar pyrophosphorylase family protein